MASVHFPGAMFVSDRLALGTTAWFVLLAVTTRDATGESSSLTVKVTVSFSGSPTTPESGVSSAGVMLGAFLLMTPGVITEPLGRLVLTFTGS